MRIAVFGLGYVGTVSAACLAEGGHVVIGVDVIPNKVDLINAGKCPVVEQDLDKLIEKNVAEGRLTASLDVETAVELSDVAFVCVGTPSDGNGRLELRYIERVCREIGGALRQQDHYVVVVRSTMLPGTMRDAVIPILERTSGKRAGVDFAVCNNPEFLREGSALHDYYHPAKTVIGSLDPESGEVVATLYRDIEAPVFKTSIDVAEMIKYVDNAWHALKIGFSNEIGNYAKMHGIDSHTVMDIFCEDKILNISPCYLKPGFAFGGSCLPKDLRALVYSARHMDLDLPIMNAVLESNQLQLRRGLEMITTVDAQKIGILGLSFKAGTDDLRESPMVEVSEQLIGRGYDLRVYDRNVALAQLTGTNRDFITRRIPHLCKLMAYTVEEVLDHAEVIVIGTNAKEFGGLLSKLRSDQRLIDFARTTEGAVSGGNYFGICW